MIDEAYLNFMEDYFQMSRRLDKLICDLSI